MKPQGGTTLRISLRNLVILSCAGAFFPGWLQAQPVEPADLQIHERYAVGVVQMVLAGDPRAGAVFADKLADWRNDLPFAADQVPAIYQDWLLGIQDKRAVPDLKISPLPDADVAFHRAYCQALAYTFLITPEAFSASAKENPE